VVWMLGDGAQPVAISSARDGGTSEYARSREDDVSAVHRCLQNDGETPRNCDSSGSDFA
jgi:hypothetical protein